MDFNIWLISNGALALVLAILHKYEVITVEFWVPKWLSDSVPDLPDAAGFYE